MISIIMPVHNGKTNLNRLNEEINNALHPLSINYEAVYMDDGSKDDSFKILESMTGYVSSLV